MGVSLVRVLAHANKGLGFGSRLRAIPGLQVTSRPIQGECERKQCVSHTDVSLPHVPSLPSTLSKNEWKEYPWVRMNNNEKKKISIVLALYGTQHHPGNRER